MRIDWKSLLKHYTRPKKGLFPVGSRVYIGRQGKGKTLSMVNYAYRIKQAYPNCAIFSNIILQDIKYVYLDNDERVSQALEFQNGENGVLVLLDEAHLMFNTKTGIPIDVLTAISQQRKDRRRIVFSSQIWNEMDMSIRKQVQEVVNCRKIGRFQFNTVYDGESIRLDKSDYTYVMDKLFSEIFKHNDEYYSRYDTYQKILRNSEYSRQPSSSTQFVPINQDRKRRWRK